MTATAKNPTAWGMRRRELAIGPPEPRSAFEVADMIAGGCIDATPMGKASRQAARGVGLEDGGVTEGGPRSKMAKFAATAEYLERVQRIGSLGGRANVMRRCELSLTSAGSGLRRGGNFLELAGRQHFPRQKRRCWRGQPILQQEGPPDSIYRTWKRRASFLDTATNGSRKRRPRQQDAL